MIITVCIIIMFCNYSSAFFRSCFLVFLGFAFSQHKTNLCVNCRHFSNPLWLSNPLCNSDEFGRCMLYPKKEEISSNYLVTGKPPTKEGVDNYYYCTTARTSVDMCGPKGKDFEQVCKPRRLRDRVSMMVQEFAEKKTNETGIK